MHLQIQFLTIGDHAVCSAIHIICYPLLLFLVRRIQTLIFRYRSTSLTLLQEYSKLDLITQRWLPVHAHEA